MDNEKKERQLEAAMNFKDALHNLRCEGVRLVLHPGNSVYKITLFDRETDEQMAEFAAGEFLAILTGQIIDEFALSTDYFGDLLKEVDVAYGRA